MRSGEITQLLDALLKQGTKQRRKEKIKKTKKKNKQNNNNRQTKVNSY